MGLDRSGIKSEASKGDDMAEECVSSLSDDFWNDDDSGAIARTLEPGTRPVGHRFVADADASEMDDRKRPTPKWSIQTCELGRNHIVIISRRMVYPGKQMMLAIHLVDDRPVILGGTVVSCDYDGSGRYRIDIDLVHTPQSDTLDRWAMRPGPRPRAA